MAHSPIPNLVARACLRVPAGRRAAVVASSCHAVRVSAGRRAVVSATASRMGSRRAIVVAASSAPGGSHGTDFDGEAVVTEFRRRLEAVKLAELAFVDPNPTAPSDTIMPVLLCAGRCLHLLDFIVRTRMMSRHQFEELALAGEKFLIVAGQCYQGYVTAEALIGGQKALDVVASLFWPTFEFPEASKVEAVVPSDLLQAKDYLEDLVHAFVFKGLMLFLVAKDEGSWVQFDSEAAVSKLKVKLDIFRFRHHPMAIICVPSSQLLATALHIANSSILMLENILRATPMDEKNHQVLLRGGERMMAILTQCQQGFVRASTLVEAAHSLRMVGECLLPNYFFPSDLLISSVPYTGDGLQVIQPSIEFHKHCDKEDLFHSLLAVLISVYTSVKY